MSSTIFVDDFIFFKLFHALEGLKALSESFAPDLNI